jgi:hypothetical protein
VAPAGQAGAGRAQSRCQQVRNASFQGQPGPDLEGALAGVAGEPGGDLPDPVAERVRVCFAQVRVVTEAEEAGPGGQVGGDVRGDDPAAVDLPDLRRSLNNPRRVTGSDVLAVWDRCANAGGAAAVNVDKQQRGEVGDQFSAICPLSVALGPRSYPHRPANAGFRPCRCSVAVTGQVADLGLCLVVQRTGSRLRRPMALAVRTPAVSTTACSRCTVPVYWGGGCPGRRRSRCRGCSCR